ncbi:hypothetical protein C8Q75DRAFT_227880 [Abortiporus biennis]|nr:hypothetical protein C8Q75DRAFT_227880 [Abortiporus biennis]
MTFSIFHTFSAYPLIFLPFCFAFVGSEICYKSLDTFAAFFMIFAREIVDWICCEVCRFFHDIISESPTLQFKFETAASGLAEGPSAGKLSLCSKQDRLRRYQKAWQSPSFRKHTLPKNPSRVFVPVVNSQRCEGVEAYILTGLRDIEFTLLGSPLNGIQERKWTIHLDFEVENFCICPSEDLLVVIFAHPAQSTARRPINYGVHHLRMSSGEHHENAFLFQDPIHPFPFSKYLMIDEAECIASGSYVGMSINAWGAETETGIRGALFMMWNWRTGVVLWVSG